jgi:hypothetical protein
MVNATLAFNLFTAVHVLLPFRYGSFGISSDEFWPTTILTSFQRIRGPLFTTFFAKPQLKKGRGTRAKLCLDTNLCLIDQSPFSGKVMEATSKGLRR